MVDALQTPCDATMRLGSSQAQHHSRRESVKIVTAAGRPVGASLNDGSMDAMRPLRCSAKASRAAMDTRERPGQ
jgi:hypothetical protein